MRVGGACLRPSTNRLKQREQVTQTGRGAGLLVLRGQRGSIAEEAKQIEPGHAEAQVLCAGLRFLL